MAVTRKRRSGTALVVILCVLIAAACAGGMFFFFFGGADAGGIEQRFQVADLDPAAKTGTPPGAPRGEKSPGEGLFSYRINATPEFDADGAGGKILVQNPAFNRYLMVLEITVNGEPGMVYQSKYIAPNQYIETISLERTPAPGSYPGTAYLNAVDPETLELVGTLDCPLTLTIRDKN